MQAQESGDGFSKQVANNNEFTFDLYKYINVDNDNLFLSPFSVSMILQSGTGRLTSIVFPVLVAVLI